MAGFIYYFPGANGVSDAVLKKHGVERVFEGASIDRNQILQRGPDDGNGVTAAIKPDHEQGRAAGVLYKPHRQTWREAPEGGYWIGYETDSIPRPMDLSRKLMLGGHSVELEGGGSWLVPVARVFQVGMTLPKSIMAGSEGEPIAGPVLERYRKFGALAEAHWEWNLAFAERFLADGQEAETRPFDDMWRLAIEALSINYRVSFAEMSAFGYLSELNLANVADAVIDAPTMILAGIEAKKNELAESSSASDGRAA